MLRTIEQYRTDLLKMKANIYIGGERLGRNDPRIQPGINVLGTTFELAQDADWEGLITTGSSITGEKINRFNHLPQTSYDLMQKQKMIRLAAQRVGGCIQRCMGHDSLTALSICTKEIDEKKGTDYHRRFTDYLRYYQGNDLTAACAQTDMKGDRTQPKAA